MFWAFFQQPESSKSFFLHIWQDILSAQRRFEQEAELCICIYILYFVVFSHFRACFSILYCATSCASLSMKPSPLYFVFEQDVFLTVSPFWYWKPKWINEHRYFFQGILNLKELLVGWASFFFILVLEMESKGLKNTLYLYLWVILERVWYLVFGIAPRLAQPARVWACSRVLEEERDQGPSRDLSFQRALLGFCICECCI